MELRGLILSVIMVLAVGQVTYGDRISMYKQAKAAFESSYLPLGFQATKRVLELMMESQGHVAYSSWKSPNILLRVCELDMGQCGTVLSHIEEALRSNRHRGINVIPYLQECQRRQEEFCFGGGRTDTRPAAALVDATEVVFARDGREKGPEEVEAALDLMESKLRNVQALRSVSRLDVDQCPHVFDRIQTLSNQYHDYGLALYFNDCYQRQLEFCN
jgi:hypothetical protein